MRGIEEKNHSEKCKEYFTLLDIYFQIFDKDRHCLCLMCVNLYTCVCACVLEWE